jgi:hypothetical protein
MCEDCEQAELHAVYLRKANRYGWRPPAAVTAPRYDDDASPRQGPPTEFMCAEARETRID